MQAWVARVSYFLPACPWGRAGWQETAAAQASRGKDGGGSEMLELELSIFELLCKARLSALTSMIKCQLSTN